LESLVVRPHGKAHVDFPASSPYVLACGGTHSVGSGGSITYEEIWNDLPDNGGPEAE